MNRNLLDKLAQESITALLYEVLLSPKPGLVDRFNNGSHNDMDTFTFINAIQALSPYFKQYLKTGFNHEGSPKDLFIKSREVGYKAELSMMIATNNINTHKGANFTFALVLCATGYLLKQNRVSLPFDMADTKMLFHYVSKMSNGLVTHDFKDLEMKTKLSYGEKLYTQYEITGIRGVAEEGYPIITEYVMPYLRKNLNDKSLEFENVFLHVLALIMSESEDTNLIHRGGLKAYKDIKKQAKHIFDNTCPQTIKEAFIEFDQQLIERNLSPGGAADLLSLSIFIAKLENII